MIRARFLANAADFRPVEWPVQHPFWCTGYTGDDDSERAVMVAYADDEAEIARLWPEADGIESEEADGYRFTDRFPKPQWFEAS